MFATTFETWSPTHALTLLTCAVLVSIPVLVGRRSTSERMRRRTRLSIGWGCVAAWLVNTLYWFMPDRFDWESSLPIHFCNVANVFGALALLGGVRLFQGVIYFWAVLCVWAFITPTVGSGPTTFGFWIFWIYHLFIALAFVAIVTIDGFRPRLSDLLRCALFTLVYVLLLTLIDRVAGWNYGFVGDSVPDAPTPVDLLGPYPIRILWMIMIGAGAFAMMWLPFAWGGNRDLSRRDGLPDSAR